MSTVTSLGTISIELSSPLVEVQIGKATQAQTMSLEHVSSKTIDDITMKLQCKFDCFYTTGCSISSTGEIVLIEYGYQRLMILKVDGTLKRRIPLSTPLPVDCACVDNKIVAVTFAASKQLQIINVLTETIERKISTNNACFGLCYSDGYLLYFEYGTGIQKVNMSGNCSSTLVKDHTLPHWSYVATLKEKIYYTNNSHHTVTCCSLTGEKMWEYKDQLVQSPRGVSVDKDSNVYIASAGNDSIIVLSSDGKQAKKVLGIEDGIRCPFGLAFDLKKGKLIVVNYDAPALYGL
ncbi:uncharacterized protein [Mytilus edulis]|uniref:uncharacterized protein n=1 Tax=Mytilus edulis TaxID=6550 RepID=UPI0039F1329D